MWCLITRDCGANCCVAQWEPKFGVFAYVSPGSVTSISFADWHPLPWHPSFHPKTHATFEPAECEP